MAQSEKEQTKWLYVGLGLAAAAGLTYFLFSKSSEKSAETNANSSHVEGLAIETLDSNANDDETSEIQDVREAQDREEAQGSEDTQDNETQKTTDARISEEIPQRANEEETKEESEEEETNKQTDEEIDDQISEPQTKQTVETQSTITAEEAGKDETETETETETQTEPQIDSENTAEKAQEKRIADLKTFEQRISALPEYKYRNGHLSVKVLRATNVDKVDKNSESDPYVVLELPGNHSKKTSFKKDEANPVWNESFNLKVGDAVRDVLIVKLNDNNLLKDKRIGFFGVRITEVCQRNGKLRSSFSIPQSKTSCKVILELSYSE